MGAPIEPGTILAGKYQVDKVLGEGGMGVVVAATDTQLERRVAIKFLLPEYAQHHEAGQRFMREARAAVKIQSEHIARVIDVNRMDNGSPYMVMEYLQGSDLSNVLHARGPLPIDEATSFVLQACEAIAEAHSYGIVHRDLKPANLFLAQQPDGTTKIKVLDFGISKMTIQGSGSTDPSLTRTSSMMGSPLYMSPEQMRSTRSVDARADIWALGVISYELLTATPPFNGESIPILSAKILLEEPESLRGKRPDVPLELEQVIQRALRKDPADRFPTISELALALLPFAPRRAQQNVERITKLLHSAGLSSSHYNASVHPADVAPATRPTTDDSARTAPDSVQGVTGNDASSRHDRTQANFGRTRGLAKRSSALGWGLAAGGLVLVAAVAGAAVLFSKGSLDGPAHAVAEEPTRGSAGRLASAAPADARPAEAPQAAPDPEPKAEPALEAPAESAPITSASAAPETAEPAPVAKTTAAPRRTSASTSKTTTKPTTTAAKAPASTADGGFRTRFGSRK